MADTVQVHVQLCVAPNGCRVMLWFGDEAIGHMAPDYAKAVADALNRVADLAAARDLEIAQAQALGVVKQ